MCALTQCVLWHNTCAFSWRDDRNSRTSARRTACKFHFTFEYTSSQTHTQMWIRPQDSTLICLFVCTNEELLCDHVIEPLLTRVCVCLSVCVCELERVHDHATPLQCKPYWTKWLPTFSMSRVQGYSTLLYILEIKWDLSPYNVMSYILHPEWAGVSGHGLGDHATCLHYIVTEPNGCLHSLWTVVSGHGLGDHATRLHCKP